MEYGFDYHKLRSYLEAAGSQYGNTAPACADWIDDLYIRLSEEPLNVSVWEVLQVMQLYQCETWEHPNYAANRAYKVMSQTGRLPSNVTISF